MANRGVGHKLQSAVESAISAASMRARFSNSALRIGFPQNGFAPTNDAFHIDNRNQGHEQGTRANPGDGGHLYSDTPTASVFLGKKQWLSDTWTYVVNSREAEQAIINGAGTDAEKAQRDGRLFEVQKRDIYERIITRKLQWLSDYEAFFKVANKLNVAVELGRISEKVKAGLTARLSSDEPTALRAADFDLLSDLEALPTGLGNNNTTRYYTSPVSNSTDGTKNAEYARALFQLRQLEKFAAPDSAEALDAIIKNQEEQVSALEAKYDTLSTDIEDLQKRIAEMRQEILEQNYPDAVDPLTQGLFASPTPRPPVTEALTEERVAAIQATAAQISELQRELDILQADETRLVDERNAFYNQTSSADRENIPQLQERADSYDIEIAQNKAQQQAVTQQLTEARQLQAQQASGTAPTSSTGTPSP